MDLIGPIFVSYQVTGVGPVIRKTIRAAIQNTRVGGNGFQQPVGQCVAGVVEHAHVERVVSDHRLGSQTMHPHDVVDRAVGGSDLFELLDQIGFRTFRILELALYHTLGKLPEPQLAHRFF